jgi:hypothetical protein
VTVTLNRRAIYIAAILLTVIGVVVGVALANRGPEPGTLAAFQASMHPYNVSSAEAQLARAANRGASSARQLVLTNQLVDLTDGDSTTERRKAVDAGLAAVAGAGCLLCEAALEQAR